MGTFLGFKTISLKHIWGVTYFVSSPSDCLALDHNTPQSRECGLQTASLPAHPPGWLAGWLAGSPSFAKLTPALLLGPKREFLGKFVKILGKFPLAVMTFLSDSARSSKDNSH